jgi:hypothetical protein
MATFCEQCNAAVFSPDYATQPPREYPEYMLPHSDFGDPECCGLFFPVERGDEADLTCNECGFVLRTVPRADLRRVQDEMQLTLDVASEKCPHCGAVNLFPGFSRMYAFVCKECGEGVALENAEWPPGPAQE